MSEYHSCPRCGNDLSSPKTNCVVECWGCGLLYRNKYPDDLTKLYPEDYSPHISDTGPILKHGFIISIVKDIKDRYYSDKIGLVPEIKKDSKILEIGCANGNNLQYLRHRGFTNLEGIELIDSAAQKARSKGFKVTSSKVEAALPSYPDNHFDCIIALAVLEHLKNPFEAVNLISAKLKPGGLFLFSTAQKDSLDFDIYREYWAGFDPTHLVFFSRQDIIDMLKGNFRDIRLYNQFNYWDLVKPSLIKIHGRKGTFFDTVIINIPHKFLDILLIPFALIGYTTRISVHCRKM